MSLPLKETWGLRLPIGCRRQAYVTDVDGARVQVSERPDKARRKILVEK